MTKPKHDYPGRVPKRHPTLEASAALDGQILASLARQPRQSIRQLSQEFGFVYTTINSHLQGLAADGKVVGVLSKGEAGARRVQLWKLAGASGGERAPISLNHPFAALFCLSQQEATC